MLDILAILNRSLGYGNDSQTKPSESELVAVQATAGTIAGACSSIITTPVDTIKTRLQVSLICSSEQVVMYLCIVYFSVTLSCFLLIACYFLVFRT
jgi:hypothetical protein